MIIIRISKENQRSRDVGFILEREKIIELPNNRIIKTLQKYSFSIGTAPSASKNKPETMATIMNNVR